MDVRPHLGSAIVDSEPDPVHSHSCSIQRGGYDKNPYAKKGVPRSKVPFLTAMLFIALLAGGLTLCVMYGNLLTVLGFSAAVWCAMAVTFMTMPADKFLAYRIQPIYPPKVMTVLRMTYFTLLFTSLAVGTLLTGQWWAVYFLAFWVVPMFTSFRSS